MIKTILLVFFITVAVSTLPVDDSLPVDKKSDDDSDSGNVLVQNSKTLNEGSSSDAKEQEIRSEKQGLTTDDVKDVRIHIKGRDVNNYNDEDHNVDEEIKAKESIQEKFEIQGIDGHSEDVRDVKNKNYEEISQDRYEVSTEDSKIEDDLILPPDVNELKYIAEGKKDIDDHNASKVKNEMISEVKDKEQDHVEETDDSNSVEDVLTIKGQIDVTKTMSKKVPEVVDGSSPSKDGDEGKGVVDDGDDRGPKIDDEQSSYVKLDSVAVKISDRNEISSVEHFSSLHKFHSYMFEYQKGERIPGDELLLSDSKSFQFPQQDVSMRIQYPEDLDKNDYHLTKFHMIVKQDSPASEGFLAQPSNHGGLGLRLVASRTQLLAYELRVWGIHKELLSNSDWATERR